eukprot:19955-Eustigmatos_ZCMA.PRE.1
MYQNRTTGADAVSAEDKEAQTEYEKRSTTYLSAFGMDGEEDGQPQTDHGSTAVDTSVNSVAKGVSSRAW